MSLMTAEIAFNIVNRLKEVHEPRLKEDLKILQEDGVFKSDAEHDALVTKFLQSNYHYIAETSFFQNEFDELRTLVFHSSALFSIFCFEKLKQLLQWQLDLYSRN